ncbi:MAG TPA: HEAT repeat domain-containing protein [Gemmata sp.]|nr:HEAT repeat domain-containing protein [Gemmata sp.]
MFRYCLIAGLVFASFLSGGCVGTWDTLTSRRFREHPLETTKRMFVPEDPVAVLLADPPRTGDDRAKAIRRLKEPLSDGRSPEEHAAVLAVLERAATADPSPVVRMDAVVALGRFQDPAAANILIAAYQNAHGRKPEEPAPAAKPDGVVTAGLSAGRSPTTGLTDRYSTTTGPTGFPPEWATAIRCRAAEAMGKTNRPEAAKFLAVVAGAGGTDVAVEGGEERDVRLAALRGLGNCRQPEAVHALAQVLTAEADKKDTAIIGRTHEGLVHLTGKKLPADPVAWNDVVRDGAVIAPEPAWWENAIQQAAAWVK